MDYCPTLPRNVARNYRSSIVMESAIAKLLELSTEKIPGADKRQIFNRILGIPPTCAPAPLIDKLFNSDYCPGTFLLSERKAMPDFLSFKDRIPFDEWIKRIVFEHFTQIKAIPDLPAAVKKRLKLLKKEQLTEWVLEILEEAENGSRLCDVIWNQEYDDILLRIEAGFIAGDPEFNFHVYQELKNAGREICFGIFKKFEEIPLTIEEMMKLSVLSGLIGINHKTSATATSPIEYKSIIPISLHPDENEPGKVLSLLMEKAGAESAIDDRSLFSEFLNTESSVRIAFILDDYIESLFDLKLAELILKSYPNVSISIIPRWGICGNDMSYDECVEVLQAPVFHYLSWLYEESPLKFKIVPDGPRIGGFNGKKISTLVAETLIDSDVLFVKGARNYEMMQGIKKNTFYSFSVCREISESITGIPASSGSPVFIYQPPGEKTFDGYRGRNSSRGKNSSYGFVERTALEFVKNRKREDK